MRHSFVPLTALIVTWFIVLGTPKQAAAIEWYLLPRNGATATFAIADELSDIRPVPPNRKGFSADAVPRRMESTLIVRCVGEANVDDKAYLWIEIRLTRKPTEFDQDGRILILKLLISEQGFGAGTYPLKYVKKAFFFDSAWTETIDAATAQRIDENPARLQYELDRFLPELPEPPKDAKWSDDQRVETGLGPIKAMRADFAASYEGKLSGGTAGKWTWHGQYQVWLSQTCPFGIVAVESTHRNIELDDDGEGDSMNLHRKMILQEVGIDAVSELPHCR